MMEPGHVRVEKSPRSIVSKISQLRSLSLGELYEVFQYMKVLHGDDVLKEFKYVLSRLYEDEFGEPLTLDEKAFVADTPEKLVNEVSNRIFMVLKKYYQESGIAVTAGSVKYESTKRSEDLLAKALRILIISQGWI